MVAGFHGILGAGTIPSDALAVVGEAAVGARVHHYGHALESSLLRGASARLQREMQMTRQLHALGGTRKRSATTSAKSFCMTSYATIPSMSHMFTVTHTTSAEAGSSKRAAVQAIMGYL